MNNSIYTGIYSIFVTLILLAVYLYKHTTYDESTLGKRSWWTEVFLLCITLTAHLIPWYLRTTQVLNKKAKRPLSMKFQICTVALNIAWVLMSTAMLINLPYYAKSNDWQNISILFSASNAILFIVWNFQIRRLVMEQTGLKISPVYTFFFGAFYTFYFVRKAYFKPGMAPSESRVMKIAIMGLAAIPMLGLVYISATIGLRQLAFAQIKEDVQLAKMQAGYWRRITTGSLSYDLIYRADEDGTQTVYAVYFSDQTAPIALMNYKFDSKMSNGVYYDLSWSSKISTDKIIEVTENTRVLQESRVNGDVLRDIRIEKEEFNRIKQEMEKYRTISSLVMDISKLLEGPGIYYSQNI